MSAPTRIERARRGRWRAGVVALLLVPAHAALAGQAPIVRFIGHWVAATGAPPSSADQSQALEFTVSDAGDGFVIAGMPIGQPGKGDAVTASRMVFRPTGQPDIYRAGDNTSPLAGGTLVWARIGAGMLDTTAFEIGPDGAFSLVETDRMLRPDGQMTITVKRFVNGRQAAVLIGYLERAP